MILAFYMYSFIQVLLIYMFIYVMLMKLLIIGVFSGEVSTRFREGFGEVSGRFREGFGQVSGRFRGGFGKVSGRFRGGFGEVSGRFLSPRLARPSKTLKKKFCFFGTGSHQDTFKTSLKAACSDFLFQ